MFAVTPSIRSSTQRAQGSHRGRYGILGVLRETFASFAYCFTSSRTLALALLITPALHAQTPAIGTKAIDFSLPTIGGNPLALSSLLPKGSGVALVFLRGYPGYQCPLCQKQVHALEADADKFAAHGIQVLMVYPGNAAGLEGRANEFIGNTPLPANFHLVLDPEFKVVNQYGLRWDAPAETAYPSTFLLNRYGKVLFVKISHTHGDRATTAEILGALPPGTPAVSPGTLAVPSSTPATPPSTP